MNEQHLALLRQFISSLKSNPSLLHTADLSFFKEYLLSLGAKLPEVQEPSVEPEKPSAEEPKQPTAEESENASSESEVSSEESDVELDMTGVIEEGTYEDPPMPAEALEVTEEMEDKASEARAAGNMASCDGNLEDALKHYSEAVLSNPYQAPNWAKRAMVLCKLERPTAAIKDCEKALELNPDQPSALMWCGRAHRLKGNFEKALFYLNRSMMTDNNETVEEWIKEIKPQVAKITAHNTKKERKLKEKEIKERLERVRKAKEANERAEAEERAHAAAGGGMPGGFPGGMPGAGGFPGMPGAGGMPGGAGGMPAGFEQLFSDPEIMAAMQDPEVMQAFNDIQSNPANMAKHQSNPKVAKLMQKLMTKFGGAGGGMPH